MFLALCAAQHVAPAKVGECTSDWAAVLRNACGLVGRFVWLDTDLDDWRRESGLFLVPATKLAPELALQQERCRSPIAPRCAELDATNQLRFQLSRAREAAAKNPASSNGRGIHVVRVTCLLPSAFATAASSKIVARREKSEYPLRFGSSTNLQA